MNNHYIIYIKDEQNRLLNFERFNLKTIKGAYNSFLKFINSYGLENYKRGFNKGLSPYKVVATYQTYAPENETMIFEKSYDEFLTDLKSLN